MAKRFAFVHAFMAEYIFIEHKCHKTSLGIRTAS